MVRVYLGNVSKDMASVYVNYGSFDSYTFSNEEELSPQASPIFFDEAPIIFASQNLRLPPASEIMDQVRATVEPAALQFVLACASVVLLAQLLGKK